MAAVRISSSLSHQRIAFFLFHDLLADLIGDVVADGSAVHNILTDMGNYEIIYLIECDTAGILIVLEKPLHNTGRV